MEWFDQTLSQWINLRPAKWGYQNDCSCLNWMMLGDQRLPHSSPIKVAKSKVVNKQTTVEMASHGANK